MAKSRQALCSVTAVALLPEASNHKQEHIILSKEDLHNILLLLNYLASEIKESLPIHDVRARAYKIHDVQTRLRYLSEVCEPPKDQS